MPTYPLKCPTCGTKFEEFARMSEREAITSPCCKAGPCESVPCATRLKLPRVFTPGKSRSLRYGCHPREVKEMRKLCPSAEYDKHGNVYFGTSKDVDDFERDMAKITARAEEKEARDEERKRVSIQKGRVDEKKKPA